MDGVPQLYHPLGPGRQEPSVGEKTAPRGWFVGEVTSRAGKKPLSSAGEGRGGSAGTGTRAASARRAAAASAPARYAAMAPARAPAFGSAVASTVASASGEATGGAASRARPGVDGWRAARSRQRLRQASSCGELCGGTAASCPYSSYAYRIRTKAISLSRPSSRRPRNASLWVATGSWIPIRDFAALVSSFR